MEALAWSMRNNSFLWRKGAGDTNSMLFIAKNQRRRAQDYNQVLIIKGLHKKMIKIERKLGDLDDFKEENIDTLNKIWN